MPKVSPIIRSSNAGEVSELLYARTDWQKYPASMRKLFNCVSLEQGPTGRRSGSAFVTKAYKDTGRAAIRPFEFSNEQAHIVEFADNRIRFIDDTGVLTLTAVDAVIASEDPLVVTIAGTTDYVGYEMALSGFPDVFGVNGSVHKVLSQDGSDYTLDTSISNPDNIAIDDAQVAVVVHLDSPYEGSDAEDVRVLQTLELMYVLVEGYKPRTLKRLGLNDYELAEAVFEDGPYFPEHTKGVTLTPSGTGNAATNSTGTPSMIGTPVSGKEPANAFDENLSTYWQSDSDQTGTLEFDPTTDFACKGYTIHIASDNEDTSFIHSDYAPSDFDFWGHNGSAWVQLDSQRDYVLYDGNRSIFFELENDVVYEKYKLGIKRVARNGAVPPRIAALVLKSDGASSITITASGTTDINSGSGFLSTDVGRLLRIKGDDAQWRWGTVTAVASTTEFTLRIESAPLPNSRAIRDWRLGAWSDTTGWPFAGTFFDDRLLLGGAEGASDLVGGSVIGNFENFAPTDDFGEVLDNNGFGVFLRSKKLANVRWMEADQKAVLVGTGSGEFSIVAPDTQSALGPLNIRARKSSSRGSSKVEPESIDNQVLFVQKANRDLREMSYVFEADSYLVPSMSIFASHIGAKIFKELRYAAVPHNILWCRLDDGNVAGLTYNRGQDIIGWHVHDFNGKVESMCVISTNDETQDALWILIRRTINDETVRYIERVEKFWDFGNSVSDSFYVDSGLKATFAEETTVITGLQHLEGKSVYGLADDVPFEERTVVDGSITLDEAATSVVIGMPFTSEFETAIVDAGSATGTAIGKVSRTNNLGMYLHDTVGGEVSIYDDQKKARSWQPIEYSEADYEEDPGYSLFSGIVGPFTPDQGYTTINSIGVRQTLPLPLTVLAVMLDMNIQDR